MWNPFNRSSPVKPTRSGPSRPRRATARRDKSAPLPETGAAFEVTEGNNDSAWALWEESVAFQDSLGPRGTGVPAGTPEHKAAAPEPAGARSPNKPFKPSP